MRIQLSLVAALCCAFPAVFAHVDGNGHLHERSTSLKVSKDGRCGGYTGQTCDGSAFGNCCNKDGWCGKSVSCCGTGCQTKFGTCKSEISTDGKCGKNGKSCLGSKFGDCCNKDGYWLTQRLKSRLLLLSRPILHLRSHLPPRPP
ncbi:hypothetical protein BU16DRAFT_118461 [Lophium mytilinum]|uniref:Chitin-binding type-1 domain-containing protein n=1 Tax=Lophium mytilinum TaxID=390894 RepID=A0A6A6QH17_9PEZI|nr:hypothetical protein BU16DRAFT_118461 [Lophium mytilinum]